MIMMSIDLRQSTEQVAFLWHQQPAVSPFVLLHIQLKDLFLTEYRADLILMTFLLDILLFLMCVVKYQ